MLKTFFRLFLLVAFLSLFVASCSVKKSLEKEGAFAELYPTQVMNGKLKLSVDYLSGSMAQGNTFYIVVENISDGSIWFANDLGIKVYRFDGVSEKWKEVQNNTEYSGVSVVVEPKGRKPPNIYSTGVVPVLPEGNKDKTIRVVVIGKIYRDGNPTDEAVGAWLDVTLPVFR